MASFSNALSSLRHGKAAYVPDRKGYVVRTDDQLSDADAESGVSGRYRVTFVPPDHADEYQFVCETKDGVDSWTGPAKAPALCTDLLLMLASPDWTVVPVSDAEARRMRLSEKSEW